MCKVGPLLQGDKVKLTITFKGREMQFQEIGRDLFKVLPHPFTAADHRKQIHFQQFRPCLVALWTLMETF